MAWINVRHSFALVFVVFLGILASSFPVAAVVTSGTAVLNDTTYINLTSGEVSNSSGHVRWDKRSGVAVNAFMTSTNLGFLNASPGKIRNMGPMNNLTTYKVPNGSDMFYGGVGLIYEHAGASIFGAGDAFAVKTSNNTYALIVIVNVVPDGAATLIWKFQSNGSPAFGDPPNTGCFQYQTSAACWDAVASGAGCHWDELTKSCQEGKGGGGTSAINKTADCPIFDGNKAACGNITVCQWSDVGSLCDSMEGFDFATGIVCPNFVNQTICNNQPHTSPLCTWVSSNITCIGNATKTSASLPVSPFTFCEAAANQQNCTVASGTYFMPCSWNAVKSKCEFSLNSIFGSSGGGGDFFDIKTESSCTATGGSWKTEQYTYTDQYSNTQTASDSWCEPSFGDFSKESCNDACWACERQSDGNAWANNDTAAQQCKNSALGFCKWIPDTNAMNGQGWCEPESYIKFGFADCSTNCFGCFKNNTCRTSAANCSWISDSFSSDANGDGTFNASEDGFCEKLLLANKKDCKKTCSACQSQSICAASSANCSWDTTSSFAAFCHLNNTAQEVCFLPGDEDSDGLSDCADFNDCQFDPFCGYGMGSGAGGSGAGLGAISPITCKQNDNNPAGCAAQTGAGPLGAIPVCYYNAVTGWCDPLFEKNLAGGMIVDSPPELIGFDPQDDNTSGQNWTDIMDVGIHESPGAQDKIDLGMAIRNLSNFAGCNKVSAYKTTTRNLTAKFYRFIDSDNNASTGCAVNGTLPAGAQFREYGFDYKFFYTENTTSGDFKVGFRCVSGGWVPFSAQLAVMKDMCKMSMGGPGGPEGPGGPGGLEAGSGGGMPGGVQIMVIKKADFGSPKGVIRIFMMTANSSNNLTVLNDAGAGSNETNPVDIGGPYYYTPGSIDKKFENCMATGQDADGDGLTADNDPDCTLFKKFGFVPFEGGPLCMDGKDNDNNGLADCNDNSCKYDPFAGCGFGMTCDPTDKSPPGLKWLEASTFPEGASISFDSDEPSNGTVAFYGNDSKCSTLNSTIKDFGLTDSITGNEFKSWHEALIDQYSVNATLGSNRTYFYKYKLCDLCGNCLLSGCTNLTTDTSYKSYVFKPVPPNGLQIDIPQLGVSGDNFTYGKQVNASNAQNIDITIKDTNNGYNITLKNVSVFAAATINITTLYSSNSTNKFVGINTTSWNTIIQKLGVKYITITIPDNGTKLWKCSDENLSNCFDVTSNASCTFGASVTNCTMPIGAGLGFSYYGVQGTKTYGGSGGSQSPSSSSGGGSGGGGGGGGAALASENFLLQKDLNAGDAGTFTYKKFADLAVYEIVAVAGAASSSPSVSVRETRLASGISPPVSKDAGSVYKYLSITKSKLDAVTTATIRFSVPTEWFGNNSLDPATTSLNRLVSNEWVRLPTKQISADAKFTSYEATTPGFSVFSVIAEKAKAKPAANVLPPGGESPKPQEQHVEAVQQQPPQPQPEESKPVEAEQAGLGFAAKAVWTLVILTALILAAVEVMHFMHRKLPPFKLPKIQH